MVLGISKEVVELRRSETGYSLEPMKVKWIEKTYYKYLVSQIQYVDLKPHTTLYFSKSSNFPRVKLENSCFKRCIKVDKADYVVINPDSLTTNEITHHYIDLGDKICLASYYDTYYNKDDVEKFLGCEVDSRKTMTFYELTEKRNDLVQLMIDPSVEFISDDTLNKSINEGDETLDESTMMAIYGMLNSTDTESIELGLKMLTGFNLNKTPVTISTLLLLNQRWYHTNAYTNVLVQNMMEQLNMSSMRGASSFFPGNIMPLRTYFRNHQVDEYDKALAKKLIIEHAKKHVLIKMAEDEKFLANYDIKINIEVV